MIAFGPQDQAMNDAFLLAASVLHIDGVGTIDRTPNEPDRWSRRELLPSSGHLITVFTYTAPWAYCERHPTGDELVVLLEGSATFLVDDVRVELLPGLACVVPTGAWHGLVECKTATMLFITPEPARTEHRDQVRQ
jgi:mannose-6-phosphate isomerase-like protein (cupin superfamily)